MFFPWGIFIPHFPPTDESTCESSVDGIWQSLTPLIYVAAANPAMSPTTPPPRAIMRSSLVICASARLSYMSETVLRLLLASPGGMTE